MDDADIELKLLMNAPIAIDGIGDLYSPTLRQIISIGYGKYNQALSSLLFDKRRIEELKQVDENNFNLTCFFLLKDTSFLDVFSVGIKLCMGKDIILQEENGKPYISIVGTDCRITHENFEYFQTIIKIANKVQIDKEDEYKPANNKAREMVELIKKNKANRPSPKPVKNLHSLISGMSWKSNSINLTNIFDLTIYQFYDGYYRMENIDHCNSILTGIYTGNIDAKNIKMPDIDWAKIINL